MRAENNFKKGRLIMQIVGDFYGVDLLDKSKYKSRKRVYVEPRMIVNYICVKSKILNLDNTGKLYVCEEIPKGLDHSTICANVNRIQSFIDIDKRFKTSFLEIKRKCDLITSTEEEIQIFEISQILKGFNIDKIKEIKELIENDKQ